MTPKPVDIVKISQKANSTSFYDLLDEVFVLEAQPEPPKTDAEYFKDEVIRWLRCRAPDFSLEHSKSQYLRAEGSAEDWFLGSEVFERWCDRVTRHLVCEGKPGSGKTIISSIVSDHLNEKYQGDPSTITLHGYIRKDQGAKHTIPHFFDGLLVQVIERFPVISTPINDFYHTYAPDPEVPRPIHGLSGQNERRPVEECKESIDVLRLQLSRYSRIFIIIDGTDEWNPPPYASSTTVKDLITEILALHPGIKLMLTSRTPNSGVVLPAGSYEELPIQVMREDIRQFLILQTERRVFKRVTVTEVLLEYLTNQCMDRIDGAFIEAYLLAYGLSHASNILGMRRVLADLSEHPAPESAYALFANRAKKQGLDELEVAIPLISWVLCSELGPDMTSAQAQQAAAAGMGMAGELGDNLSMEYHLISICAGLVVWVNKRGPGTIPRIEFVHPLFKEYLQRNVETHFPDAECQVTRACFHYMDFCLRSIPVTVKAHMFACRKSECFHSDFLQAYELLEYCASKWGLHHARSCKGEGDPIHDIIVKHYLNPASMSFIHTTKHIFPMHDMDPQSYLTLLIADYGLTCMLRGQLDARKDDVSCKDQMGRTPLSFAAQKGHLGTMQFLLARGARVDDRDVRGRTPLSYATGGDHVEALGLLLERGANINNVSLEGETLLCCAASSGAIKAVKFLLDRGVDVNQAGLMDTTPISYAASRGKAAVVKLLLERGADVNYTNADSRAALSMAARHDFVDVMELLLDWPGGVEVDKPDNYGRTPLSYAAEYGASRAVRMLVDRGVYVNLVDQDGIPPFFYALEGLHVDVAKILFEEGADPKGLEGDLGEGPLLRAFARAARNGKMDMMKFLLENGLLGSAGPDHPDMEGRTPLSYAAEKGRNEVMRMLLDLGADPDRPDNLGVTPLSYVAGSTAGEVSVILDSPREEEVEVDRKDHLGRIPLSYASFVGRVDIIRRLLDAGANSDVVDNRGRTPLSYAAENGRAEAVKALLLHLQQKEKKRETMQMDVDVVNHERVDRKDSKGRTPLSYAIDPVTTLFGVRAKYRVLEVIRALVEAGARLDAVDEEGKTPFTRGMGTGRDVREEVMKWATAMLDEKE